MAVTVVPNRQSFGGSIGSSLGSGLGQGLSLLLQNKVKQIHAGKVAELFQNAGYTPEASHLLAHLQQQNPQHFNQLLSGLGSGAVQEGKQPVFGGAADAKSEVNKLKIEQRKDKLRPDLNYLDDLERTSQELKELISNQEDPVDFGYRSAIGSKLPWIGNQTLKNASTGAFDALSNKFHTDAASNAKGVRSVYHVKILGASKPGLDKTREQNEKILAHWDKVISEKKAKFLKAHPEFADEIEQKQAVQSLPDPSGFKEGDIIRNGNMRMKLVNGQWEQIS